MQNSVGSYLKAVWNGRRIAPFTNKDIFSRAKHDEVLMAVNALLNFQVNPPTAGDIKISDTGTTLDLSRLSQSLIRSAGASYRGLYSASTGTYNYGDLVYVGSTPATRYFYVCEIVNGLSTTAGAHAPDATEVASPLYWRLVAAAQNAVQELSFGSWGYGGSNDYITCSSQQVRLPPTLRFSVSSRTAYGVTISYSSYNTSQQSRVANNGVTSATQYVTPQYLSGDKIYVVSVGGVLQDLNVDGRVFAGP